METPQHGNASKKHYHKTNLLSLLTALTVKSLNHEAI